MSFIDDAINQLDRALDRPWVTEVHETQAHPTTATTLRNMVGRVRGSLREAKVLAGDRVMLIAGNSAEWVAVDLGILSEGAICVPLYEKLKIEEVQAIIEDCNPKLIACSNGEMAERIREQNPDIPLRSLDALCAGTPVLESPVERQGDDLVTLVYTSGTSGVAKGVGLSVQNVDFMIGTTTRALRNLMEENQARKNQRTPAREHRIFHYLPFCFAGSRIVLWTALCQGSGIWLSTDLTKLRVELKTAKPHYLLNVPTLLERMKDAVDERMKPRGRLVRWLYETGLRLHEKNQSSSLKPYERVVLGASKKVVFQKIAQGLGENLRCLICGSAPLGAETQAWFEAVGLPVYQVYGLTETTAIVTMDEPGHARSGYVGRPIPGCEIRVDENQELLVRGPNVFGGYWNRPEETERAFLASTSLASTSLASTSLASTSSAGTSSEDGGKWFRTGDRAERDETGRYRILGRLRDVIVPTSGHNVAPEPLEKSLQSRISGVEHAVVLGHGRPHLVALLSGPSLHEGATRDEIEAAIDAFNRELPPYKRIRAFTVVNEAFSADNKLLTANQKLRRRAIEEHFASEIAKLYAQTEQPQRMSRGAALA